MPAGHKYKGPPEALTLYKAVVASNPEVEVKGAANPYTSRNGHMFSFLDVEGSMALRLSKEMGEEFMAAYESGPVIQYGSVMNGYVSIPDTLLGDPAQLQEWFNKSHHWIGTLEPKPTKKG